MTDKNKLADELHAFIAAAPHEYPGHLVELFERAESALRSSADSAVSMAHPRHSVYFMCQCCEEENPENAVCCREDIGIMPDGTWLCDNCYSDCEKTAYGLVANDVEDFEFPRFEDLPRPAPYIDSAMRTEPLASADSEDDPTASPAWNDGCDFAMTQLCIFLGVNQSDVEWDAATETVDGDVQAVIGNILRAKFGEDWGPRAVPQTALCDDCPPDGYPTDKTRCAPGTWGAPQCQADGAK